MQSPHSTGIAFMPKRNGHKRAAPANGQKHRAIPARHWFDVVLEAARVMQPITLTRGKLELGEPVLPPIMTPKVTASEDLKR